MVPILLLAAALRWAALPEMADMLGFDESAYAADAAAWLASPRPTPFFPANNGREGGWIYLLAAFMAGAGYSPFIARLAAGFLGVLAVAATYRLGREMFGRRAGLGAAAGMAVLYWPVHLSHIAMRANLLPALGALSLAFLLAAIRTRQRKLWLAAGLCGGVLAYTYTSAQAWAVLVGLLLAACALRGRRGALIALLLALGVAAPMAIYAWRHPDQVLLRVGQSATLSGAALVGALEAWLRAWLIRGDILLNHNIPGRPILDPAAAVLFGLGVLSLIRRRAWRVGLVGALAGLSILPSLLSEFPPHFLRSVGLTVPIALLIGLGAANLARLAGALGRPTPKARLVAERLGGLAAGGLLLITAGTTYHDFHGVWLRLPAIEGQFERPIHRAVQALLLDEEHASDAPIYFAPYELTHPVIQFSRHRLAGRRVGAFDSRACLVVPRRPATYVVAQDGAALLAALEPWGRAEARTRPLGATMIRLWPADDQLIRAADWVAQFGAALEVRAPAAGAQAVARGETLTWQWRFRALRPLPRPYSLFVHLYRIAEDGSVDVGRKWAQGDQQLCASYPTTLWQADEVIVQAYALSVPEDAPPGRYGVAIGVYDSDSGERLADEEGRDYRIIAELSLPDAQATLSQPSQPAIDNMRLSTRAAAARQGDGGARAGQFHIPPP
jgi:hypothetical protein